MDTYDFKAINNLLLAQAESFLQSLFPSGKIHGNDFKVGDLSGSPGDSLKVNLVEGNWKDFATGEGGADLISLYAKKYNITQGESLNKIKQEIGEDTYVPNVKKNYIKKKAARVDDVDAYISKAVADYKYTDEFRVVRFEIGKKKITVPLLFENGEWYKKNYFDNRPLYNLSEIDEAENILIVEGEKTAVAAEKFFTAYVVTTWSAGTNSIFKTDWSKIKDKNVLIWPDNDTPGIKAAKEIADLLYKQNNKVKLIDVERTSLPKGWDVADTVNKDFVIDLAKKYNIKYEPIPEESIITVSKHDMENSSSFLASIGVMDDLGKVKPNESNILRILENHSLTRKNIWYDTFHNRIYINDGNENRAISDIDYINYLIFLQDKLNLENAKLTSVRSAVDSFAYEKKRSEPQEWVKSLTWDGTPRVTSFFEDYCQATPNAYSASISQNWWVGLVARIMKPACKNDQMVILEGLQGIGKSTLLEVIGDKWFTTMGEEMGTKDFYQKLHGHILVEIAELDAFRKSEVNTIKKVLSEREDTFRPPYGRNEVTFKRQCIFVGTTNNDDYLRDPTGARRFWPLRCVKIDTESVSRDREQLFAEAYDLFKNGTTWHEVDKAAKKSLYEMHKTRTQEDVWKPYVQEYLIGKNDITVQEILCNALDLEPQYQNRQQQMRVVSILKNLDWTKGGKHRVNGVVQQTWVSEN